MLPTVDEVCTVAKRLIVAEIDAVNVMHTDVVDAAEGLSMVRALWDGPLGVYPHHGIWSEPNWTYLDMEPDELVHHARGWLDQGVSILGVCCGLTARHVAALRAAAGRWRHTVPGTGGRESRQLGPRPPCQEGRPRLGDIAAVTTEHRGVARQPPSGLLKDTGASRCVSVSSRAPVKTSKPRRIGNTCRAPGGPHGNRGIGGTSAGKWSPTVRCTNALQECSVPTGANDWGSAKNH